MLARFTDTSTYMNESRSGPLQTLDFVDGRILVRHTKVKTIKTSSYEMGGSDGYSDTGSTAVDFDISGVRQATEHSQSRYSTQP